MKNLCHSFGVSLFLVFPTAVFSPKAVVPIFLLSVLVGLAIVIKTESHKRIRFIDWRSPVFLFLVALVGLGLISAIWSLTPANSLRTGLTAGLLILSGAYLVKINTIFNDQERQLVQSYLIYGGMLGFGLLGVEHATNTFFTRHALMWLDPGITAETILFHRLNSVSAVASIFFWPWSLAIYRKYPLPLAILMIAAATVVILFGEAIAPVFALIAGATIFVLCAFFPRRFPIFYAILIVIGVGLTPIAPNFINSPTEAGSETHNWSPSGIHRLYIWQTTAHFVKERPLLGYGFDTARSFFDGSNRQHVEFFPDKPEIRWKILFEPIPLHPHNGILQIWLELGFAGALAAAGFLLSLVLKLQNIFKTTHGMSTAFAALSAAGLLVSVSFGMWQNWWLAALVFAGVMTTMTASRPSGQA